MFVDFEHDRGSFVVVFGAFGGIFYTHSVIFKYVLNL